MEERIQVGLDNVTSVSDQSETTTQKLWWYGKQVLKGVAVFGVGLLGYVGIKRFVGQSSSQSEMDTKSQNPDFTTSSTSVQSKKSEAQLTFSNDFSEQPFRQLNSLDSSELADQSTHNKGQKRTTPRTKRTVGDEFQVNTFISDLEPNPKLTALNSGGFVVIWNSRFQLIPHKGFGLYGQIYDNKGKKHNSVFHIDNELSKTNIATLATGDFVVVWKEFNKSFSTTGIYGQLFNSTGSKLNSKFHINTNDIGSSAYPNVISTNNANFIVVWSANKPGVYSLHIYGQLFNSTGGKVGREFQVNPSITSSALSPNIAALSHTEFVVTWSGLAQIDGESKTGVYGQCFNDVGSKKGPSYLINSHKLGTSPYPDIVDLNGKNFLLAWEDISRDGLQHGVFTQKLDCLGNKQGSKLNVNTNDVGLNSPLAIATLSDGGFVVVWASMTAQLGSGVGIHGQHFDSSGNKIGGEFRVNTQILGDQRNPRIATLRDGSFVVIWEQNYGDGSNWGVYGKIFSTFLPNGIVIPSLSANRTYTENEVYFFFENPIVISVYHYSEVKLQLTVPKEAGWLLLPNKLTVNSTFSSETGLWEATGLLDDINTVLNYMVFIPTQYYDRPVRVHVQVFDPTLLSQKFDDYFTLNAIPINQPPSVAKNNLVVKQGKTTAVDSAQLQIKDVDTPPIQLTVKVLNVKQGQFEHVDQKGVSINTFTQEEINTNKIRFVTDDSELSPSGLINVTDGEWTIGPRTLQFSFTSKGRISPLAIALPLSAAGLLTIATGIGYWRWQQNKKQAKIRRNHPVANSLRKLLHLKNLDDFKTTTGQAYLNLVQTIKDTFKNRHNYDIENMTGIEMQTWIGCLAQVIKKHVNIDTTTVPKLQAMLMDIQFKINRIIEDTCKLLEEVQSENWQKEDTNRSDSFLKKVAKAGLITGLGLLGYVAYSRKQNSTASSASEPLKTNSQEAVPRISHNFLKKQTQNSRQADLYNVNFNSKRLISGFNVENIFKVNTYNQGIQIEPSLTTLSNGNFVVTWLNIDQTNWEIYAQIFSSSGNKTRGEFKVTVYEEKLSGGTPSIATLNNGDFIIVWGERSLNVDAKTGIYAQHFNSTGGKLGPKFPANTNMSGYQETSIAPLYHGGYVVTWTGSDDGTSKGIICQLFNATDHKLGSQFIANTYTAGLQYKSAVAPLGNGGFIVAWESNGQDGSMYSVYAQQFKASGSKISDEFRVNTHANGEQTYPNISILKEGKFIIVWSNFLESTSDFDIFAQIFSEKGVRIGGEFKVNTYSSGANPLAKIATLSNGDFVVVWMGYGQGLGHDGIRCQRFDAFGNKIGFEFRVKPIVPLSTQATPSVTGLNNGEFALVWKSIRQDGSNNGIYGRIFSNVITLPTIDTLRKYTENDPYFFLDAPFAIDLYYLPNTRIELTLPKEAGQLLSPKMPNVTSGFKPETATWYATGELQAINELLKAMIFVPNEYYDKPFDVQVRVVDETGYAESVETSFSMQGIAVDQPPSLVNNTLSVKQGQTLLLNNTHLGVYDVDTPPAQLTLTVLDLQNGRFEKRSAPGTSVTTFTQQFVNDGKLQFVSDDTGLIPLGNVSISDGNSNVGPIPLTFSFTANRDVNKASIAVPISVASLIALMGGIGLYRYGQHKKDAKTRKDYPLANAVYKKLNLKQVANFKSKAGQEFVRIIEVLEEKFTTSHDYEFDVMSLVAIDEFADYLVHAIKQEVLLTTSRFSGTTFDLTDLELQQERIVKATMTFVEKDNWVPRQGVVKEKYVFDDEESSNALEMSTKKQLKAPLIRSDVSMH